MSRLIDLISKKFGRLTVVGRAASDSNGKTKWLCRCDCGVVISVYAGNIRRPNTQSCGCLRRETTAKSKTRHGNARKGLQTAEYRSWASLIGRCTNGRNHVFASYGGRGITVCDRWRDDFEVFLSDMGPKPGPEYSIDRIDNNRGYEPGNCRWATAKEQARNRRNRRVVEFQGVGRSILEWTRILGLSLSCLRHRFDRGWSTDQAFTIPYRGRRNEAEP